MRVQGNDSPRALLTGLMCCGQRIVRVLLLSADLDIMVYWILPVKRLCREKASSFCLPESPG